MTASRLSPPDRLVLPALMLGAFFVTAPFASIAPFLNEISADLGVSEGVTGQLSTVGALAAVLAALSLAPFGATLRPRPVMIGALAAIGAGTALGGVVPSFPALLAFQFVVGAAAVTLLTSVLLATGRVWPDPAMRARRQGLLLGAEGLGPLLGTPLLRWIASWASWQAALVVYGSAALLAAGMVALLLPASADEGAAAPAEPGGRLAAAFGAARQRIVGPTIVLSVSVWLTWGVLGAFLAGYFDARHPGADGWIAALWMADGVAFLVGACLGGQLVARLGNPARVLTLTLAAMALALASFAALPAGPLATLLSFGVWVALLALCTNAVLALYQLHAGERVGAVLFLDSALGKLGQVAGGLLGGVAIELAGGEYLLWSALLVGAGLASFLPLAAVLRHLRAQQAAPRPQEMLASR